MLNLQNLRGLFAALPIAARPDGTYIEEDYRADIDTVCGSGVHGIYTTGTTGEWYAMDDEEFRWMVGVFLEQTGKFETLTQIGCGGLSTESAVRRVKIAVSGPRKPDGLQILLPPWQPLTDDEVVDFLKAIADAAEGIPLIHYNTRRSKRFLTPREYERILPAVPTLIGSKTITNDIDQTIAFTRASLPMNHFIGHEWNLVAGTIWGSKGIYSDYVCYWPKASLKLWALCEKKAWAEAFELQDRFINFRREAEVPLEVNEYTDSAWDKGKTEAGGFLRCKRHIRLPYRSMSVKDVEHMRSVGKKHFAEWIESR